MAEEVPTAVVAGRAAVEVASMVEEAADSMVAEGAPAVAARLEAAACAVRGASADLQTEARHLAALAVLGPVVRDLAPWAARARVVVRA